MSSVVVVELRQDLHLLPGGVNAAVCSMVQLEQTVRGGCCWRGFTARRSSDIDTFAFHSNLSGL